MASSMFDSELFDVMFTTDDMKECFGDEATIAGWIKVWKALAKVEAEHGIIPKEAADEIIAKGDVKKIDFSKVRAGIMKCGHPLMPTLELYEELCDNHAGQFLHYGATTQDLADTGWMLMMRDGFKIIYDDMRDLELAAMKLTEDHKETLMAGRTHGQQALPITFGYKTAIWVSEIRRQIERMKEVWDRDFVGQLSGAVGTCAGYGDEGDQVCDESIRLVGLDAPEIAWHTSRDRIASVVNCVSMVAYTAGHIAHECTALMKTEIGEVQEGFVRGAIGSSTMPHKRNPVLSEISQVLAKLSKASAGITMESMFCEHERDASLWRAEWRGIGECMMAARTAVFKVKKLVTNLDVNKEKMLENLDICKGLMYSEPVMFLVGEKIGKQTAHTVVYDICMDTFEKGTYFIDELMANKEIAEHISREQLEEMMNPAGYIGKSVAYAERVIKNTTAARENDELRALGTK